MTVRRPPARATISAVADLAGVSIKTVSRVTNNAPHVRPEIRRRVEAAIAELGYHPMQSARNLATRSSRLLALVYASSGLSPSWLLRMQQATRQCCLEYGFRLLLHPCDHRDPRLATELPKLASRLHLEGIVLSPPVSLNDAVVRALGAAQVPVSLLAPARLSRGTCSILLDDEFAARVLCEHLLSQGHRRIGFVRGHPDHESSRARLAGFRHAMAEAGVAVDEALIVSGDYSFESGRTAGAALLDRQRRPTAIVASNDDMAAGVMIAAHGRGLEVPADLGVCGFDDTPLASMLWPPLTTMHQPISELAYAGTRMLLERLRTGRAPPPPGDLRYDLVIRASTAAGPRRERGVR